MTEINISVKDDKTVSVSNVNLGDKYDNQITKLIFFFNSCSFSQRLQYKYFAIKNENKDSFQLIDITNKKEIILDYEFTKVYGRYNCLIILSEKELTQMTNDKDNFVSNTFSLSINDNFLTGIKNLTIIEEQEAL
jgi:hypothetical protein